jgi:long-chain acyl-CoA synthetase
VRKEIERLHGGGSVYFRAQMSEIVERFARIRRDTPARRLIHLPIAGTSLTAGDIWDEACAQRSALQKLGLGPDYLLVSAAGNRPSSIALWLACRELGIAIMPIDAGTPPAEIASLARRFGATFAIVPDGSIGAALGTREPFVGPLAALRVADVNPSSTIGKGAAALKVTSGSTGLPKATVTRESHLVADTLHITTAMGIRPDDLQIAAIPLSHAYGLGNLVLPLLLNGTAIVLREAFVPQAILSDAVTFGARLFHGVPFMFAHFIQHFRDTPWPRALDSLISAGAPLDPVVAREFAWAFGVKIHSFYGTSETGGISFDDSSDLDAIGSVGSPLPGVTVALRPEEGAPADGGRVHVSGDAVVSGYAGQSPDAADFIDGGYLTGDYARRDAHGRLTLTGRASSFINVAGKKIQPEEVERVLRTMPGIDDVRVVGAEDAVRGQQVVACVVIRDAALTAPVIRSFCALRLAGYKVPRTIIQLDGIPLTERGKTDRAALDAIVRERLSRTAESGVL